MTVRDLGQRYYSQIESSADFRRPEEYVNLLGFYSNMEMVLGTGNADAVGESLGQYVPMTSVSRNPKMFVIGILPPPAQVTGRILDRSASVAAAGDVGTLYVPEQGTSRVPLWNEDLYPASKANQKDVTNPPQNPKWGDAARELPRSFWVYYVSMCRRLGVDPVELAAVMYNESGFNPAAQNFGDRSKEEGAIAKGLIQFISRVQTELDMPPETWKSFQEMSAEEQVPWVEKFLAKGGGVRGKDRTAIYMRVFGGYNADNPEGWSYVGAKRQQRMKETADEQIATYESMLDLPDTTPEQRKGLQKTIDQLRKIQESGFVAASFQAQAYELNKGFDKSGKGYIDPSDLYAAVAGKPPPFIREEIEAALASGQNMEQVQVPTGADSGAAKLDAEAYKIFLEYQSKISSLGYNATPLGEKFTAAQRSQIQEAQDAIRRMSEAQPLRMLVNPSQFAVKGEKIASDGNWTRNGPIIEHWGDGQDKISASGSLAGFFAVSRSDASSPGLTRSARFASESYLNFMSLFTFYKNNGHLYLEDPFTKKKNLALVGSVYLYYDNILYIGSFDSLNATEDATSKVFSLDYSFEFTVRACFLLDRPLEEDLDLGPQAAQYFVGARSGVGSIPVTSPQENFLLEAERNAFSIVPRLAGEESGTPEEVRLREEQRRLDDQLRQQEESNR